MARSSIIEQKLGKEYAYLAHPARLGNGRIKDIPMPLGIVGLFGLNTGDWTTIISSALTVFLLWQQNQIFQRQNEIFASQAGTTVPSKSPLAVRFNRYWPTVIMVVLMLTIAYDYYDRHASGSSVLVPWWHYVPILLIILGVLGSMIVSLTKTPALTASAAPTENPKEPSKLIIHSANYRAWQGGGNTYDVTEFLRQIIYGDSLVFDIENHNFVIGGQNFVPIDPLSGKVKRLRVTYSYRGDAPSTIERSEHGRLVLPEDSEIQRLTAATKQTQNEPSLSNDAKVNDELAEIYADVILDSLKRTCHTVCDFTTEHIAADVALSVDQGLAGLRKLERMKLVSRDSLSWRFSAASAARAIPTFARKNLPGTKTEDATPKPDALCEALKEIASTDAEKINERVQEIGQRIEFHFVPGSEPSIDVITELWNGCVFDLVNFGEIYGHVTYGGRQLAADPRIIVSVEPVLLNLKHGCKATLIVRQYLSAEMADTMEANRNRGVAIDFGNVTVTFQSTPLPGFSKTFRWFGPRFAIEDTKRVS